MAVHRGTTNACAALALAGGVLLLLSVTVADVGRCQVRDTCNINLVELGMKCGECISPVVGKRNPSPSEDCCKVVRKVDIPCACKYIAGHRLPVGISMDKLCHVARFCGVYLKPDMKCGEYSCSRKMGGEENSYWVADQINIVM